MGEVIVSELPALSLDTLGIIQGKKELWYQSDPKDLAAVLDKIAPEGLSPATLEIITQFMITDTTGAGFKEQTVSDSFFKKRLQTLFKIGAFEEIIKMTALVAPLKMPNDIRKIQFDTLLIYGQSKDACTLIDLYDLGKDSDKMRIACLAQNNEKERASLAYDLYKERVDKEDILFNKLCDHIYRGAPLKWPAHMVLKPYHLPLIAQTKTMPMMEKQPLWVLKALLQSQSTPIVHKIKYAERLGDTRALLTLYPQIKDKKTMDSAEKRAVLYQKITALDKGEARILLLSEFIESVKKDGLYLKLAPIINRLIIADSPKPEAIKIAFDAAQISALTRNVSNAYSWYMLLQKSVSEEAQKQAFTLMPMINSIGAGMPDVKKYWNKFCTLKLPRDSVCADFLTRAPAYFENASLSAWLDTPYIGTTSYPANVIYQIRQMQTQGKMGESVLWALLLLSHSPYMEQDLLELSRTVLPRGAADQLKMERIVYQ
ncbi:MAG: hypothetical protein LBU87_06650 [Lactobacillales bacterium]|nr:hypothetical protein [Lactobacillales bacterium]